MTRNPRVAGVCGSLRDESRTRVALRHALAGSGNVGATTDLIDLREVDLPLYDGDRPAAGDALALRRRIRVADAVVLAVAGGGCGGSRPRHSATSGEPSWACTPGRFPARS